MNPNNETTTISRPRRTPRTTAPAVVVTEQIIVSADAPAPSPAPAPKAATRTEKPRRERPSPAQRLAKAEDRLGEVTDLVGNLGTATCNFCNAPVSTDAARHRKVNGKQEVACTDCVPKLQGRHFGLAESIRRFAAEADATRTHAEELARLRKLTASNTSAAARERADLWTIEVQPRLQARKAARERLNALEAECRKAVGGIGKARDAAGKAVLAALQQRTPEAEAKAVEAKAAVSTARTAVELLDKQAHDLRQEIKHLSDDLEPLFERLDVLPEFRRNDRSGPRNDNGSKRRQGQQGGNAPKDLLRRKAECRSGQ